MGVLWGPISNSLRVPRLVYLVQQIVQLAMDLQQDTVSPVI